MRVYEARLCTLPTNAIQIQSQRPGPATPRVRNGLVAPPRSSLFVMSIALLSSFLPPVHAGTKHPGRPQFDQILSGSFASGAIQYPKNSELVLVNWNIERGVRQAKILQALHGPLAADLYVLQEVDLHTRRTGYRNVAEEIACELRMNYVFGIEFEELAQERANRPAFQGQAVLSRFPISQARVLRFRHQLHNWGHRWMPRWSWLQPRRGGRMALVVEVQLGGQTWVIYDTHLESKADDADRVLQMREILEDIQEHYPAETPVIVAGDLNTHEGADSPVLRELKARGFQDALQDCKGPLQTKPGSKERIDWVFMRHSNSREAGIPKVIISDHYPLVVRIGVP